MISENFGPSRSKGDRENCIMRCFMVCNYDAQIKDEVCFTAACMGKMRNVYKVYAEYSERKKPLVRLWQRQGILLKWGSNELNRRAQTRFDFPRVGISVGPGEHGNSFHEFVCGCGRVFIHLFPD
jgi:hypothetical protein